MQPEWQDDVYSLTEEVYLRAKLSKKAGLKTALGVPVSSNGRVLTVLVFYMTTSQPKDEHQLILISAVVAQLGTLILQKQAEEELNKYREHLEKMVKKRTKELEEKNRDLEQFNVLFIDREFRIKELRDRVKELEQG